tara:strand:- start:240 stop:1316 length:1077 start_codon:yes stop_codon:yes gene_type:complete
MFIKNKNIQNLKRKRSGINRKNIHSGIFLNRNERILPFDDKIKKKLYNFLLKTNISLYPNLDAIYDKLSKWLKLSKNQIFITDGLDGAVRLMFRCYTKEKKSNVIFPKPSFAMYDVYSKMFGVKSKYINYNNKFELKVDQIYKLADNNTSIIFLPNPNMPIESFLNEDDIEKIARFCEKKKIILFIDEVYFHFNDQSSIKLIKKYRNMYVSRSFSKAFGLAGVRFGYLISNNKNILYVSKSRSGYECNSLSANVALFFISNTHIMKNYVKEIKMGIIYLKQQLDKLDISYNGGNYGNFLFISLKNKKLSKSIVNHLIKKNIFVRDGWHYPYNNGFSISSSSKNIMKIFIKELKCFLNK